MSRGFVLDLVLDRLLLKGFKDVLLEWGGDVKAVGMLT